MSEEITNWSSSDMLEVTIKQPDDFLKVRETLTRIGVAQEKIKHYINRVIFYTNKANITLHISKNYLL